MDDFLAELDRSSSVLALDNVNRDEALPLSTFSGEETIPLTNQINSTPDDEILLLPPLTDPSIEGTKPTNTVGFNKVKNGDKDILTGETREMSAVTSDSLLGKNSDELASVIDSPVKPKKPEQKPNKEDDVVEEIPLLANDVLRPNSGVIQTRNAFEEANIVNNPDLTSKIEKSSDPDINTIIGQGENALKWNLGYLENQITYGFIGSGGYYDSEDYDKNDGNVYYLSDDGKNTIRKAIGDLEEIIPVDFKELSYSLEDPPIMVFLGVEIPGEETAGYATYPNPYYKTGGDVCLDLDYQDDYSLVAHEIGHALGLKHPGNYNGDDSGPFLSASRDNKDITLMSYNPGEKPLTEYRPLDIKALQYLYGSNETEEIPPEISIGDVTITEGDRTKQATFKITLDTPATQTVQVDYETIDDTAGSGNDYGEKSGTITFKPGQKTKQIRVPIYGDNLNEGDRGFWVNLTNPRNAEINDELGGYGSIIEDDLTVTPSIKINDISITEGDRTKQATFKVTLDTPATQTVQVDYETIDDTASSGDDYRYKSATITFKPGQKTKKIRVPIYGDNLNEGDRGFWVNLTNPRNAEINDEWGSGSIIEDDLTVTPSIKINDISITEGDRTKQATFKITLDTPATQTVQVDYQTIGDTAWSGYDYRYKSGTITFKPGQKTKKIRVPIYGDNLNEGDRGFWVNLTNPRNAEINDEWGSGSIIEDDF